MCNPKDSDLYGVHFIRCEKLVCLFIYYVCPQILLHLTLICVNDGDFIAHAAHVSDLCDSGHFSVGNEHCCA